MSSIFDPSKRSSHLISCQVDSTQTEGQGDLAQANDLADSMWVEGQASLSHNE